MDCTNQLGHVKSVQKYLSNIFLINFLHSSKFFSRKTRYTEASRSRLLDSISSLPDVSRSAEQTKYKGRSSLGCSSKSLLILVVPPRGFYEIVLSTLRRK